ncbi:TonB-dependent receptor [Mariprofundus sp. EBB-1]|uniref:TonB-dependent receptor plug domain-containing protein n=1 Tax=Mariprofundus sp. EBB-1 TaxID=2650971 RepID=UPI000EF2686F|nr:TonB-dependent receptor [Mariprofundus sp. EBB-1]RLL54746.1 TonB-dependent receptor [Mariprofundus sp. EBB-1]
MHTHFHPSSAISRSSLTLASLIIFSSIAIAEDSTPIINVEDTAIERANTVTVKPLEQDYIPADAADTLKSVPGANVNKNGPLTGIAQYRGMFGSRINTQLDGLNVAPAGPNWMDPPLSHLPTSQMESITVIRGISPVSAGAESIGGSINAKTAKQPYSEVGEARPHGSFTSGYESNNNAYSVGGQLGGSSASDRLQLNGNLDKGQAMQAGNGLDILPTQYQRRTFGADYGHRFSAGEFSLGYNNERVDNSGSPALPMDIIYVKGNAFSAAFNSDRASNGIQWFADAHYMDTDHNMDNYSLRTPPAMLGMGGRLMQRFALTNAKDIGYKLHAIIPVNSGSITVGTDGWLAKHQADVFDPTNAAFSLQNYNNVKRNRFSLFTEWKGSLSDSLEIQTGVRYSRVNMSSGTVSTSGFAGMMATAINTLATNFNASQRSQNDNLIDISLLLTQTVNDNLKVTFGAARKQRAPSYQERYLWSPLESTAGLADKRTYVGDVNLNPETSYNVDLGLEWKSDAIYFTPRLFFKRVNNYIQGTASTTGPAYNFRVMQGNMLKGAGFCTANPLDPFCVPLQFSNVDADMYGADAGFGANITDHISVDGTISYVRGKRRDITDNLYRIAPLNSTIGLSYYGDADWSVTAEGNFFGKQDKVSSTNAESKTAGYSLFNLHGRYALSRNMAISAGVNNVLDRFYQDHLSGYNRITTDAAGRASAVATGTRLPGEGRNFFVQAHATF